MCSKRCAVTIVILINSIIFLVGGLLLAFGVLAKFKVEYIYMMLDAIPGDVMEDVMQVWNFPAFLHHAAILLIAIGAALVIISVIGCSGACGSIKCLLIVYMLIVALIVAAQVAFGVLVYFQAEEVELEAAKLLRGSINNNYTDAVDGLGVKAVEGAYKLVLAVAPIKLAWDSVQIATKCCGVYNTTDYSGVFEYDIDGDIQGKVPLSCCALGIEVDSSLHDKVLSTEVERDEVQPCLVDRDTAYTHTEGCLTKFKVTIRNNWIIFGGIVAGIVLVELLAIIAAAVIYRKADQMKYH